MDLVNNPLLSFLRRAQERCFTSLIYFGRATLGHLFPPRCLICQQSADRGRVVCTRCDDVLPHNANGCRRCAFPLAAEVGGYDLCGRCIKKLPAFDYAISPWRYEQEVVGLIHQMKFNDKASYARALGSILCEYYQQSTPCHFGEPDTILPVPLHPSRLRQRGYNQSIELSRVLADSSKIPVMLDAVRRIRKTTAQVGLDARSRVANIRGAFDSKESFEGEHILIIDDVMTTGSTVDELARLLKNRGASTVGVLCLARAPMK